MLLDQVFATTGERDRLDNGGGPGLSVPRETFRDAPRRSSSRLGVRLVEGRPPRDTLRRPRHTSTSEQDRPAIGEGCEGVLPRGAEGESAIVTCSTQIARGQHLMLLDQVFATTGECDRLDNGGGSGLPVPRETSLTRLGVRPLASAFPRSKFGDYTRARRLPRTSTSEQERAAIGGLRECAPPRRTGRFCDRHVFDPDRAESAPDAPRPGARYDRRT
jgi:hypothetical protein